jgi:dephospho-CoA kinase
MSDYVIGLTGGIASGKSEVSRRFEALGIPVADADLAAREAVAIGSDGLADVVDMFGTGVLAADGSLDRPAMRRRVFNDPDARKRLEGIIHPHVRELLHAACASTRTPYAIAAVPLLAESGGRSAYPWVRRILVVDVPEEVQLQRLLRRDGIDEALAARMMSVQASRRQRLAIADDVLANDGPLDRLDAHVAALDRLYRTLAA